MVQTDKRQTQRLWLWAGGVFLAVRLLLTLLVFALAPSAPPPATGSAADRLVQPWNRWDVVYYADIAAAGYGSDPATTNFHPLYAWLGRGLGWLSGSWVLGLLLASSVATIGLYVVLQLLARFELTPEQRPWSIIALTALPSGYVLYAPYSESLFLLLAALCFLLALRGRWWLAGLAGAVAALTRQQGLALVLPLLWLMAAQVGGWSRLARLPRLWLAALLPVVGYGLVIAVRLSVLGGLPQRWWLPQNWIYAVLISPEAQSVVPGQRFVPPWTALWLAVQQLSEGTAGEFGLSGAIGRWVDLITGALYLGLLGLSWRRLRPAYRVYCVLIFLLAWSYYTGELFAYMGLSRHLLLAFPLAFPLAAWADRGPRRMLLLLGGGLLLVAQTSLYMLELWVP